jgi:DNA-binding PadR family transcriptional regulator
MVREKQVHLRWSCCLYGNDTRKQRRREKDSIRIGCWSVENQDNYGLHFFDLYGMVNSSISNIILPDCKEADVMLTNVELVIMRFIKVKPSYAYEMENIVTKWQLRQWVMLGGTTIYQVLNRLCKRGLLEYKVEKAGNMPERRRYYITPQGEELVLESLRGILTNIEPYYFDLSVGLACRRFLDKNEFEKLIGVRLEKLNAFIEDFNEIFEKSKVIFPTRRVAMREYLLSHYELERALLEKLLSHEEKHDE